jgi:hypothetical protein
MITEFRLLLTATFNTKADRDAAISALTPLVQNYATNHSGAFKRADISGDEYLLSEDVAPSKIV